MLKLCSPDGAVLQRHKLYTKYCYEMNESYNLVTRRKLYVKHTVLMQTLAVSDYEGYVIENTATQNGLNQDDGIIISVLV